MPAAGPAQAGGPVLGQVRLLLGVGGGRQGEAEPFLDPLDRGLAGGAVGEVAALRQRAVGGEEGARVLAAVEGGGEPGVAGVVLEQRLQLRELGVARRAAEAEDLRGLLGLRVGDAAQRGAVEALAVVAGVHREGQGGRGVGLGRAVQRLADLLGRGLGVGLLGLGVVGVVLVCRVGGRRPVDVALGVDGQTQLGGVLDGRPQVLPRGVELVVRVAQGSRDRGGLLESGPDLVARPGEGAGGRLRTGPGPAGLLDRADHLVLHLGGEVPGADHLLEVARRRVEAGELDVLELGVRDHGAAPVRPFLSAASRTGCGSRSRCCRSSARWCAGSCRSSPRPRRACGPGSTRRSTRC